jgi:hypothetical protein
VRHRMIQRDHQHEVAVVQRLAWVLEATGASSVRKPVQTAVHALLRPAARCDRTEVKDAKRVSTSKWSQHELEERTQLEGHTRSEAQFASLDLTDVSHGTSQVLGIAQHSRRDAIQLLARRREVHPTLAVHDLHAFQARGGKMLMYHGRADSEIAPYATLKYYDDVVKTMGGQIQTDDFFRLFMIPGMYHWSGDPGGDPRDNLFAAIENWVEGGVAPDQFDCLARDQRNCGPHSTGLSVPECGEVQRHRQSG